MAPLSGDGSELLPTLSGSFSSQEISMALTECGLLVDSAEDIADLYADTPDWTEVERRWFEERKAGRSTKKSSKKVFRNITTRFKTAGKGLPPMSMLPAIFDACETSRSKAQILYLYLLDTDPLVRYTVHEYIRRFQQRGDVALDFEQSTLIEVLEAFEYTNGEHLTYAESTLGRWCEGFRSVMRNIGVIDSSETFDGSTPALDQAALLTAAAYAWQHDGEEWLSRPRGWLYLFQPESQWDSLAERVATADGWTLSELRGGIKLKPEKGPYQWVQSN